mgnify:CR=1 FL=1
MKNVRIHIHSILRRISPTGGVSAHAAIDGLIKGGILPDDRCETVKEICFTQDTRLKKSRMSYKDEETIIEVLELDQDEFS